jgi:FkbM family methyltransferase
MNTIKNIIYKLVDILTLDKGLSCNVNGFKIKFPAKWFRYFENDYEKENIEFLKKVCKPEMIVFDIGAHLGLMSMICAQLMKKLGKVYAFEPTPKTFEILEKVIGLNKAFEVVIPINKAVAKDNTTFDFYLSSNEGSNSNSLVSKNHRDRKPIKIHVTSLDLFVAENSVPKVDLIKIDAEGSEYDVLLGAQNVIAKYKPIIILALHPPLIVNNNQDITNIYDFLTNHNYTIIHDNKVMSKHDFCTKQDFFDVHLQIK